METIEFSVLINAEKQKVWKTMLNDKTYRLWAKEFHEGSYFQGGWGKGSKILFLAEDKDGKPHGMYSRIKENINHHFISIEHLGLINNGVVDTTSEEVKKWAPSFENYTFTTKGTQTEVKVEMQVDEEYKIQFNEMWQRALNSLKALCEI